MAVFYFFAAIVIWLGILSVRDGIRFTRFVRFETAKPLPNFTPFASIIAPCRGLDQGLRENLAALFKQDYPAYEIIFVTDNADDPSLKLIREVEEFQPTTDRIPTSIVIAGDASDSGQKVHNLRVAVGKINRESQVLVFVDTDARPSPLWLRSLVAPLSEPTLGAATGYRWFIPVEGGLASHLRSVWNASIASALGPDVKKNFCWGGSMAIGRETFERLNIRQHWQGTVSDDFTVTRVLKGAGLPIQFVPNCLTPSLEDCSASELFEFTTRQLKITRAYAAHLWRTVLVGSLFFSLVFFGGIVLVSVRVALGLSFFIPLSMLATIFALGAAKAYIRLRAIRVPLANYKKELKRMLPAHLLLWPISSALYLYNAVAAAVSRRIAWRGISYELKSPTEAVIISRE